jgi:hypothetical protein
MYKKPVLAHKYSMSNIIVDMDNDSISISSSSSSSSSETKSDYEDLTCLIESLTFSKNLGTVTYKNITVLIADNCLLFDPIRKKVFVNIFHIIENK